MSSCVQKNIGSVVQMVSHMNIKIHVEGDQKEYSLNCLLQFDKRREGEYKTLAYSSMVLVHVLRSVGRILQGCPEECKDEIRQAALQVQDEMKANPTWPYESTRIHDA